MKGFWPFLGCVVLLLGLSPMGADQCDIYVANVGSGNCVCVLFSTSKGSSLDPKRKGLWVDCGLGSGSKRGLPPPEDPTGCPYVDELDEVVGGYFFGGVGEGSSPLQKKAAPIEDTMLWVTHLHADHVCGVEKIGGKKTVNKGGGQKRRGSYDGLNVGSVVVGVRCDADLQPGASGAGAISKILNHTNATKVKVWGGNRNIYQRNIRKTVDDFLKDFPDKDITLEPLIPSEEYGKDGSGQGYRDKLSNENDTSLVLALTYHGVRVLFPGDAPGEMYDCLELEHRKSVVRKADILVAPHHGSEDHRESMWYSSNRRFCTIISGDPSLTQYGIPGLANYGVRNHLIHLESPRTIYYSNARRNRVSKGRSTVPVFCTWSREKKLIGYHIMINSEGGRDDAGKIKVFEILYDEAKVEGTRYPEKEIEITRESFCS